MHFIKGLATDAEGIRMDNLLLTIGRAAGVIGVLLCGVAVLARFAGYYSIGGLQVGTLFQAGMAAMILACLFLLLLLTKRSQ